MFTGLVRDIGKITKATRTGDDTRLKIQCGLDMADVPMGASICCSGCCLTVTEKGDDWFCVDVSAESLSKTTIGKWEEQMRINIEPSLKMGDELGGHFVFGHVDTLAELISITQDGGSYRLKIKVPESHARYIAPKGSVALDGISLTVNEVEGAIFGVNIIPHTWEKTTLKDRVEGDTLNFEADMLARYVARQLECQTS